jgi:hypothetical protein
MTYKSDLVDISLHVHLYPQSRLSVIVSETGNRRNAFPLPLSQIQIEEGKEDKTGIEVLITMPQWLAEEKKLYGY